MTTKAPLVTAARTLPSYYSPGYDVSVTLTTTPTTGSYSYAVQDAYPIGWAVKSVGDGGAHDVANALVKFGPYLDNTPRTLTYVVTAPVDALGEATFTGEIAAGSPSAVITGDSVIAPAPLHPADQNPANARITIGEATAYGTAWRSGNAWSIAPENIPIDYVTRAGLLWRAGETYRFDSEAAGAPLWWINAPAPAGSAPMMAAMSSSLVVATAEAVSTSTSVRVIHFGGIYLTVTPASGVAAYAVEEDVPVGLVVSNINESGEFDVLTRKVRWGPFFDANQRTLTYAVSGPDGSYVLGGVASFDGSSLVTTGDANLSLGVYTGFEAWSPGYFTSSELSDLELSGPLADPDQDDLTNLMEYALGLDPKSADATGLPEMGNTSTDWTYTYTRPADRSDLAYTVEVSTDLIFWTSSGVTLERISEGTMETWQAKVPLSTGSAVFFRLKVAVQE